LRCTASVLLFPYTTLFRSQELGSVMKPLKSAGKSLKVEENDTEYRVTGTAFEAIFVKSSGALQQLVYKGQEIINGAVLPNFVRPDRKSTRLNSSHVKISYA